jgi:hypothetical protein
MAIGRREVRLTINGDEWWVSSAAEARLLLQSRRSSPHSEIWLTGPEEQALCILVNGETASLLSLPEEGEPGWSSVNPDYDGPEDAMAAFVLADGRQDEVLASSAVPLSVALQAAEHFVETFEPAPFVVWSEDVSERIEP